MPFVLVMAGLAGASIARNRQETGRSEAIRSALNALRVHNRSGAEIVFALRRPVPAGTAVRDGGPASPGSGRRAVHSNTRVVARAKDRSWFFYEDLAPFQEYAHAGQVVLVDVKTGRVSVSAKLAWPPTLNGRLPVFLASQTAYLSPRYRVFYRPYTGAAVRANRASSRMSSPGVRLAPAALDPTQGPQVASLLASEHACVVRFSDTVRGGYYAFAHIAQSRAALAFRFSQLASFSSGFQSFIYSRTSGVSPTVFVADQISAHGCKDVMLYLAGGGYPGGAAVNIGMGINVSDPLHQDVSTTALRGLVGAHPGVNFELVLDAPHASAFQSLEGIRNVLLVAAAVAPGDVSFTYLPEARVGGRLIADDTNPLHILQLTDRLAYGLDRVIDNPSEVAQLEALRRAGKLPSPLAYIVARAFALGAPVDFVARSGVGSPPSVHFHGFTAGPPGGGGPPPPPVITARPDSYTVAPPGPLSVAAANGVLANDSDSADNALRVDKLNGVGGVAPLHGTSAKGAAVTLNDDGSFTYDPAGVASLQGLSHGQSVTDTFSYRATDRRGGLGTATVTITVTGVNHPPVASSDGYAANSNVTLTQNAAGGVLANDTDADGDALIVDQLNGSGVLSGTSAKGAAVTLNGDGSFSYDPTGSATLQAVPRGQTTTDTFTYRANDGHGATATATVTITVTGAVNHVPVATPDGYAANNNVTLTQNAAGGVLANDTDPDGDALIVDQLNGSGVLSGTSAKGAAVTVNADGSFSYDPTISATLGAIPRGQATTDTFTYRANDGHGATATATVTITVTGAVNHVPVATPDGYAANNNVTLTQNAAGGVLANDTDPDGDALIVDQLNGSGVLSGTSAKGAAVTLNGDGSFSYDPTGSATLQAVPRGQTTTDTFTYRANDGHGATATATVTITVTGAVNHAPVASPDAYTTDNNAVLAPGAATGVLANDTDADGDALIVDQLNGSGVLSGTSAKGAAVTLNGDGSFSYDPTGSATLQAVPRGQTTTDTFTYRANDGHGATATATVTITAVGVNHPPIATPDSYAVNNDTVLSQSASGVLANDTDADGDTLVVDQLNGTGVAAPFTGTSAKGAGVTLNGDGSFSYDPTGAAALHPPQLAVGSSTADTFTYEAADGHGGTATATATITVTAVDTPPNAPSYTVTGGAIGNTLLEVGPVASPSSEPKLTQGSDGILSHASDPDVGDSITVTAFDATSAQGGDVSVDGASGAFTYRPKAGFTGTDSFHYTVTDTHGKSATGTITINVSNMVWYVQNNASGTHDGRSGSPFNTLASAESAAGSAAGDIIYVFKGDGTNTGQNAGITLKTNQTLLSDKYDLAVGGHTLATGTPANRPVIGNSAGAGVTLASGDTVKGFDITGTGAGAFAIAGGSGDASGTIADNVLHGASGAGGLTLNATSGTWAVSDLTATGTGGAAFDATAAGTVNFTGTNSLTGTAATAFKTAGATTYSGTIATTSSTGGAANGIDASGAGGSITFNGGTLSGTTANAILAAGGNANITYSGTETNNAGHSVNVSGRTGGTITIASSISDTGTGITLTSNAGSAIVFTDTITASTGTNSAFTATGGGTVSASDTASTLTTTTGTALDVEGATIGGSNLMFRSISASGGSHGIVLVNTGSFGHLSVSGTGTAGSGGSITAITGADAATNGCADLGSSIPAGVGVYLKNTTSPSLAFMSFPGTFGNFGILGYGVSGFTLDHTTMTGTYGDNVNQDEDTVHFCTLTGSASITNDTISNGAETNLRIVNGSGTLNRLTITNDTIGLNQNEGGDGTLLEADGGTLNATVEDSTFQGSRGSPFQAVPQAGASMDLVFGAPGHGNTIHNTHPNIVPFAQDLNVAAGGTLTFDVNSNHFDSASAVQAQGGVFINATNSTANASGYFRNNTIGTSGVANSGSSGNDPGLDIESNGGGDLTIKVDNNQMFQWGSNGAGFLLQAGATSGNPTTFNATVTNNTIAQPGTFAVANTAQGFQLNNGTNSGENFTTCLLFSGNVVNGSGSGGGGGDARFRQRFDTKVDMPGYTGAADGSTGSPTVVSYIQGLNPTGPPSVTTVSSTAAGGGFFNTPGGAACPLPSF